MSQSYADYVEGYPDATPATVANGIAARNPLTISSRLSAAPEAIREVLRLRAMRPGTPFVFSLREDDDLG